MELILQQGLSHQQKAIDAVSAVFEGVHITAPVQYYENPRIDLSDGRLQGNLLNLQSSIPVEHRTAGPIGSYLNLDIKMETGTGKTYVYTKTIYELNRRYGINKFIIAVPSLAIKAGTEQFISDDYTRRHFSDTCGYGTEIALEVLEAPKNKKRGRSYFPGVISEFVKGSCQNTRKIYVLLVNMQLLTSNTKRNGIDTGLLWRDDYDYGAEGFYRPFDAIRATRPIVIIDEPHRFSREQKAFQTIVSEIKPQCIIRYGATFPETTTGRGKSKITVKDYQNLLYDLNACESFNQGLIKGVAKEHFEPLSRQEEKVKILSIASKDSVKLQHEKHGKRPRTFTMKTGDSLAVINDAFEGITIDEISATEVKFSNGVVKTTGMELDVDVYMSSYQEQMLRLALQRHFETEKANFCGRSAKIKTLALFFIDDIASYRPAPGGKEPYLLTAFERLLKERLESTLESLDEHDAEYRAYLEASLADVSACHAGYFSQDNDESSEEIAQEVDAILHGKKQLLSFRKDDGSYNTLRFLFSKWTLKEGWDNPNVFTIAKLRSSGSENSKLQEVGRGLRLPVDEYGNRISQEEFQLNYIVDFTEKDFAQKLVDQINRDVPESTVLTEERITLVAGVLGKDPGALFAELLQKQYIDWQRRIVATNRKAFFAEYPPFAAGLHCDKVKDRNTEQSKPIKIRKAAYSEIRELWEYINQRYLLLYDPDLDAEMEGVVLSLLEQPGVFTDVIMSSRRDIVVSDGSQMSATSGTGVQYTITRPIPYGTFLSRITHVTNIPVAVLHAAMTQFAAKHGGIDPKYINESSASAFCAEFQSWKVSLLQGRFRYVKGNAPCGATALSYADGTPREEIPQGRIGTKIAEGTPSAKYLYDTFAYDSPLEKENLITSDIEDVVVYGKIPRRSIAIPTITGGTYSPDFMYVVRKKSGEEELNIVVETKDVEGKDVLRGNEAAKIACAKIFFENLSKEGYVVHFRDQINNKQMAQIINEVLSQ